MPNELIYTFISDPKVAQDLEQSILRHAGYQVQQANNLKTLESLLEHKSPQALFLAEEIVDEGKISGMKLATDLARRYPNLSMILVAGAESQVDPLEVFRAGILDLLKAPPRQQEVMQSVQRAALRSQRLNSWAASEAGRATQSLQHSMELSELERQRLEALLTHIQDGVLVIDPDGNLSRINTSAQELFGIQDAQARGKPVCDVLQQQDLLVLIKTEQPPAPRRGEVALEDGRVYNAQVTPIAGVGLAVVLQDITRLKELDRIKSDFVSAVSHDLRSPLTAILGYVELIEKVGAINDQQRAFIRNVQLSVQNITALINDLLDLSRIEAGFDLGKVNVSLATIIDNAVDSSEGRLQDKSLILKLDISRDLPPVFGNPVRLRQVFTNLIGNAIKYTPPGGDIYLHARVEDNQILILVQDSGIGIPVSDLPFIFDRFYRASNVNPDTPGSGLGLAIVRSIVEGHHGRIWVESTSGQGTKIAILLPIAEQVH